MVMSFAHGSNDVANAIGPYAAVYYVYKNKKIPPSKSPVPKWIYVMGKDFLAIFIHKLNSINFLIINFAL